MATSYPRLELSLIFMRLKVESTLAFGILKTPRFTSLLVTMLEIKFLSFLTFWMMSLECGMLNNFASQTTCAKDTMHIPFVSSNARSKCDKLVF